LKRRKLARPKVRENTAPTTERTIPAAMRVTRPTAKKVRSVPMIISFVSGPQWTQTTLMLPRAAFTFTLTRCTASSQSGEK